MPKFTYVFPALALAFLSLGFAAPSHAYMGMEPFYGYTYAPQPQPYVSRPVRLTDQCAIVNSGHGLSGTSNGFDRHGPRNFYYVNLSLRCADPVDGRSLTQAIHNYAMQMALSDLPYNSHCTQIVKNMQARVWTGGPPEDEWSMGEPAQMAVEYQADFSCKNAYARPRAYYPAPERTTYFRHHWKHKAHRAEVKKAVWSTPAPAKAAAPAPAPQPVAVTPQPAPAVTPAPAPAPMTAPPGFAPPTMPATSPLPTKKSSP
ncbi:MAG TPA: hypothetical protein VHB73_06705 [Alphaproteobacteria bacterium]|nr:hypothetical protein [Alphaproteobacteria bacterium]